MKRPSVTISKATTSGTAHVTVAIQEETPTELYLSVGKAGSDISSLSEALGRLVCLCLTSKPEWSQQERVYNVIRQLKDIGGVRSRGGVNSLPHTVAMVLQEVAFPDGMPTLDQMKKTHLCPTCGMVASLSATGDVECATCSLVEQPL